MTKEMLDTLEEWLSKNFCPLIETTGTLVCRLIYKVTGTRRDIAIAFSRYHHDSDPAEYIIGDAGYVLTVPSFWLNIPKELVVPYLTNYIDSYMKEYVFGSGTSSGSSGGGAHMGTSGISDCSCTKPPTSALPGTGVCPSPPPSPHFIPCPTCDEPVLNGYYVNNANESFEETTTSSTGTFSNIIKSE